MRACGHAGVRVCVRAGVRVYGCTGVRACVAVTVAFCMGRPFAPVRQCAAFVLALVVVRGPRVSAFAHGAWQRRSDGPWWFRREGGEVGSCANQLCRGGRSCTEVLRVPLAAGGSERSE